ncbi:MAG: CBU_0592 family membrane protein [Gaiellaceae bacterium]
MGQVVQIAGALMVLAAFALAQVGVLGQRSLTFLLLNLVGATALAVEAYLETQWGFLLLEAAWAVVAAWGLAVRGRYGMSR